MNIRREWAMPSRHTFTIRPIAALLSQHPIGDEWVDPFAGFNSPAGITNDLNPDAPSLHHLPALDFLRGLEDHTSPGVLFDPPYSSRQVAECYRTRGRVTSACTWCGSTSGAGTEAHVERWQRRHVCCPEKTRDHRPTIRTTTEEKSC